MTTLWNHSPVSKAGCQLSSNPSIVMHPISNHKDPLETLPESKKSSGQNFWAWKCHSTNQSKPLLDHSQLYRLMKQIWTLWNVRPQGQPLVPDLPCKMLTCCFPTSWEKLEKCLEILGRTVRTELCVFMGFLEYFIPCQFAMNSWIGTLAKNRKTRLPASLFKGEVSAATWSWYFSEPFGYN